MEGKQRRVLRMVETRWLDDGCERIGARHLTTGRSAVYDCVDRLGVEDNHAAAARLVLGAEPSVQTSCTHGGFVFGVDPGEVAEEGDDSGGLAVGDRVRVGQGVSYGTPEIEDGVDPGEVAEEGDDPGGLAVGDRVRVGQGVSYGTPEIEDGVDPGEVAEEGDDSGGLAVATEFELGKRLTLAWMKARRAGAQLSMAGVELAGVFAQVLEREAPHRSRYQRIVNEVLKALPAARADDYHWELNGEHWQNIACLTDRAHDMIGKPMELLYDPDDERPREVQEAAVEADIDAATGRQSEEQDRVAAEASRLRSLELLADALYWTLTLEDGSRSFDMGNGDRVTVEASRRMAQLAEWGQQFGSRRRG